MPKAFLYIKLTIFIALLIVLMAFSATAQQPDSDFQVWNETVFQMPVVKGRDRDNKEIDKFSILVLGVLRLGQERLYPTDVRVGAGFDYRINRHISFSPTYIYSRSEPVRNSNAYEHRVRFDVHIGNKWRRFSLRDRNRVEYRSRNSRSDSVRYRNRLTLSIPVLRNKKEIFTPFVSNEVYYDFSEKKFTTNEITAGISRKITKNITTDIFYLRRDFRSSNFKYWNGIGVNLKIRID